MCPCVTPVTETVGAVFVTGASTWTIPVSGVLSAFRAVLPVVATVKVPVVLSAVPDATTRVALMTTNGLFEQPWIDVASVAPRRTLAG